jgi:drug/metabolite transporter (DMT)-like permease
MKAAPILALLGGAALGASSGLYIKGLAFSSMAMTALRMMMPLVLVFPSALRHGLLFGKPGLRGKLFLASTLNAVRLYLYVLSYKLTSMGNAVVLLYLWPIFTLLLEHLRHREHIRTSQLSMLLLSLFGVILMNIQKGFSITRTDLLGSICMIASAFIYAWTNIMFKDVLSIMSEVDTLYFQNVIGALVFLPFLIVEIPKAPFSHLGIGVCYGVAVGCLGFWILFYSMKRMPIIQYSALSYSEVPFAVLFGILFRGEQFSVSQGIGMLLIVLGSFLSQRVRTSSVA